MNGSKVGSKNNQQLEVIAMKNSKANRKVANESDQSSCQAS